MVRATVRVSLRVQEARVHVVTGVTGGGGGGSTRGGGWTHSTRYIRVVVEVYVAVGVLIVVSVSTVACILVAMWVLVEVGVGHS